MFYLVLSPVGKIIIPRTYHVKLRSHIVQFNVQCNFDVQRGVSRGLKCTCKAQKIVAKQKYYFFIDFPCLYLTNRKDSTRTLESFLNLERRSFLHRILCLESLLHAPILIPIHATAQKN